MECADGSAGMHFLNLNGLGRWQGFSVSGLELQEDGSLGLIPLPSLVGELPDAVAGLTGENAPAGLATTPDGAVYFSDPANNLIWVVPACPPSQDGASTSAGQPAPCGCAGDRPPARSLVFEEDLRPQSPLPCLGGYGQAGGQFDGPRGLAYHPLREALIVADSGNDRLQLFDPLTYRLKDIWGGPGSQPGRFDRPWSVAVDADGNVYVVDYGNQRVQKFDRYGQGIPEFWQQIEADLHASGEVLHQPAQVAVGGADGVAEIYILDEGSPGAIFVFSDEGRRLRPPFGQGWIDQPAGLAAGDGVIYVGNNARRRIYQFSREGFFAGAALHYEGPIAALALRPQGDLLALADPSLAPFCLAARGGFSRHGVLWGGPFYNPAQVPQEWHRLRASFGELQDGAHFQFFVYCSSSPQPDPINPPPAVPPWSLGAVDALDCLAKDDPSPDCNDRWVRFGLDAAEGAIQAVRQTGEDPGQLEYLNYVWVGAELSGEGYTSPSLSQIMIDFDHETYLRYLPPLYLEQARSRQYLGRFLTLIESLYNDVEDRIGVLPRLFDPMAAPPVYLPWLAGWQAFDLEQDWGLERKRRAIAGAFALHGQRGTPSGLQAAVRLYTGVNVGIEEPIQQGGWWVLPGEDDPEAGLEGSVLGFNTCLLEAEADGAVLGSTATLDGSQLITGDELGAPLFSGLAHRFNVRMYRGASYSEQALAAVTAVLEREKPAHTLYHICTTEPKMRIGFQARLGIDTIIAGAQVPSPLDQQSSDGGGLLLGGDLPGRLDPSNRIGQATRLGGF